METDPPFHMWNVANATQPDKFNEILEKTFSNLSMYATSQTNVTSSIELQSTVRCTPDLSPTDCVTCLDFAVSGLRSLLDGKKGGRGLAPSCDIRYELYTFLLDPPVTAQPPALHPTGLIVTAAVVKVLQ
ncbi:Cysteine-rich repeat secretory protein 38 [Camellia lanceoleosa]|uniref:Cysteine-rich repeat secretory protein 38 n=1 Tax=Camellia lanceoleosa TaxID=1840588 RepID=A0ACC0GJF3_9ERIC|nr:Cysteine-rich repeat secretory protein 38 [Camellia lanceoleosa]